MHNNKAANLVYKLLGAQNVPRFPITGLLGLFNWFYSTTLLHMQSEAFKIA